MIENKNNIILNIILPIFLSIISLVFIDNIDSLPLILGVLIGAFSWKQHRYNHISVIFLSVLIALVVYALSIMFVGIIKPIDFMLENMFETNFKKDKYGVVIIFISSYIIAPVLSFWLYRYIIRILIKPLYLWTSFIVFLLLFIFKLLIEFTGFIPKSLYIIGEFKTLLFVLFLTLILLINSQGLKNLLYKKVN